MSPYIGRRFDEVKEELESINASYTWEIARVKSGVFNIDEQDLYVLREQESSTGERKLVLSYACKAKAKGGKTNGV